MSSRRGGRWSTASLAGVAALTSVVASPLSAQQTADQWKARYEQRLDSLIPLRDAAQNAVVDAYRREFAEAEAATRTDTISVGPFMVVTLPEQVDLATEMIGGIWDRDFGPIVEAPTAPDQFVLTFAWPKADAELPIRYDQEVGRSIRRIEVPRWRTRAQAERAVRDVIAGIMGSELIGSRIGTWMTGSIGRPTDGAATYRQLAGTASQSTQDCLVGGALRCWTALAADLDADAFPVDDWYSPEERREMVRRRYSTRNTSLLPQADACIDGGDVGACDELIQLIGPRQSFISPLYEGDGRAQMLWLALHRGGPGAWDRLRADPEMSPGDALRAASGMSTAELSEAWRTWVMENRPDRPTLFEPEYLFLLGYVGLFAALAMRSTRWRLG